MKANGYFPGIATVGGLIVGVENHDGNTNVRFHQADTLRRIIGRLEAEIGVSIRNFRVDCGSFSEAIIDYVKDHCERFYVRASNCRLWRTEVMEYKDWTEVTVGGTKCGIASFPFDGFLPGERLRLVVQRTRIGDVSSSAEPEGLFGTEYMYRCILTNDWDNSEQDITAYYNRRGASERNFDCQNNDFGWVHLPFSYLKENTVFLLVTAMLKNFYLHILETIASHMEGIDVTIRLKRFVHRFISIPAKWIRSGRQEVLNRLKNRKTCSRLAPCVPIRTATSRAKLHTLASLRN